MTPERIWLHALLLESGDSRLLDAELAAAGSSSGTVRSAANLLAVPQSLFLFTERTIFVCIGVLFSADGTANHCHSESSHTISLHFT